MIGAATRYRELLTQLLMHRELAGGTLPEEVESQFVEELDRCWWVLSAAEQADIENELAADAPLPAAPDLAMADRQLTSGMTVPPREAA